MFQELFVPSSSKITPLSVKDALKFPINMSRDEKDVEHFLLQFLENAESDTLEKFLIFATGVKSLPKFGFEKVKVKFGNSTPSIYASTCLLHVIFPSKFENFEIFSQSLTAVIGTAKGKSFNCV